MTEEMMTAIICRKMKWTYQDFRDQPAWFVEIVADMFKAEAEAKEKAQ